MQRHGEHLQLELDVVKAKVAKLAKALGALVAAVEAGAGTVKDHETDARAEHDEPCAMCAAKAALEGVKP